jgi:signal recognition particle GTPase
VNRLLKQFVQMRKMLKMVGGMSSGKPDWKARAKFGSMIGKMR